jgi:aspartate/methionine/tyrosine aminotransferase
MNPALQRIAPSLIRAIHARKRPGDIDLGLGEPVLRPDAAPFEAAMRRVRDEGTPYSPNAGFTPLREAVARYHALPGMLEAASVCITIGSEEALYVAVKTLVDPARDEVLVVEPGYLAYPKFCDLEGIRHRSVRLSPEDGFQPRAAAVLEALGPETRLVILNTPCNPTGRVWPEDELGALASGLAARAGEPVWVVVDEVYRELYYSAAAPASLGRFHPHTVTVGSLSKSNALTGMRIGWLVGDATVVSAALKVHALLTTAASTFSQWVAEAVFATPGALSAHRPVYAERRETLIRAAAAHGVEIVPPEGAFYAMVKLPPALSADSLGAAGALLDTHRVLAVPGVAFGAAGEGWLRISWVADDDTLNEGLARIGRFFQEAG